MMPQARIVVQRALDAALLALMVGACVLGTAVASPGAQRLNDLLARTAEGTSAFLGQFSNVKCTEQVSQEKLGTGDAVEVKEVSTYDYLVILTNGGGELNLSESRIPLREAKRDRKNTSMLLSNGFATLFLVFHPYYSESFKFTLAGDEVAGDQKLEKINFQHIHGMKSPAALALRGREYPLELSGTAWVEPDTGSIVKIEAGVADSLQDVGLKTLRAEIDFAPLKFPDSKQPYWFPTQARIEVETPKQHWRNVHQFTSYKQFSVSTEEQIIKQ